MKAGAKVFVPMSGHPVWTPDSNVIAHNIYADVFTTPHARSFGAVSESDYIDPIIDFTTFTINQGDHILICHAAIPGSSGNKLATTLNTGATTAFASLTDKLHLSLHEAKLGDGLTNYIGKNDYSSGFESRAQFAYFDRENFIGRVATSTQIGAPPYGPSTFPGVASFTGTGTDAGIGDLTIDALYENHYYEHGPLYILRWTSGNAPPIGVIETAMEWMWYEWNLRDNYVVYPPLINY